MKIRFPYPRKSALKSALILVSALVVTIAGIFIYAYFTSDPAQAAWFNDSWKFRKKLTINHSQVSDLDSADFTNFPVLVNITNDSSLRANAQADGDDFAFTSSDGTQLDHEIESYDANKGTLTAWVEVPTLDYNDNTIIYMYYGNPSASDQSDAAGTWDDATSSYQGVWHLNDTPTGSADDINDSTSNNNEGTSAGSMGSTSQVNGKMAGSLQFIEASSQSINKDGSLVSAYPFTVSAWVKQNAASLDDDAAIIFLANSDAGNQLYGINIGRSGGSAGKATITARNTTEYWANGSTTVRGGGWHHVVGVFESSTSRKLYVNGALEFTDDDSVDFAAGVNRISIGRRGDSSPSDYFNDSIDEARLSTADISDGWIATEYNNQSDPAAFFSVGGEETHRGPILYLGFDEGQGSTAYDSSPEKNNGTITGATWKSEDLCVFGKCLYFDGTDDYVGVGSTAPNVQSVSFWVKPQSTSEYLIDFDSGTHYISASSGTITATGFTSPTIYVNGQVSSTLTANTWNHIEITTTTSFNAANFRVGNSTTNYLDGFVDEVKIYDYVRGPTQIQADFNARGSIKGVSARFGGGDMDYLSKGLVGYWKMDEASWDGSANEVIDSSGNGNHGAATYTVGNGTGTATSATANTLTDTSKSWLNNYHANLLITITAGTGSGQIRTISSNNSNTITVSSDWDTIPSTDSQYLVYYYPTTAAGKFGNGGSFTKFTGALTAYHGTHVNLGNNTSLRLTGAMTLSAWVNSDTFSLGSNAVISKKACCGAGAWELTISSTGIPSFTVYSDGSTAVTVTSNTTLSTGTWYHLTGVYNPGQSLQLFINGKLDKTLSSGVPSSQYSNGAQNVFIGSAPSHIQDFFDGIIDEARVYNRALSPKEVRDLYNWAPGPVGYWNFEEGSGTIVNDLSGNSNTGTWSGTNSHWASGKYGKAGNFTGGTSDEVSAGSASILDDLPNGDFTFSWWQKYNSSGAPDFPSMIGKRNGIGNFGWNVFTSSGLRVQLGVNFDTTDARYQTPNNAIVNGQWQYISIVWSASSKSARIYINGIQSTLASQTPGVGTYQTDISNNFIIGGDNISSSWSGNIDEFKIYNYARTQKQIVSDMNAGHPAVGSPVGSAVAHWDMDEGYGTSANDLTGNSNTLTLSSASWTNAGKFGKAWNGTNAVWLSRADDSDFDVSDTDDYAVSLWFKSDSADNPGAVEYLFNKANATTAGYAVYADTSGYLCFGIDDDTTWGPDVSSCTSSDYYDNSWHHLVAVRDYSGTDKVLIYIDGVLKASASDTTSATLANSLSLYVGDRDGTDNGDEFTGDIDEVKVYRYALTADEIKTDFNRGSAQVLGSISTDSDGSTASFADSRRYCVPGDTSACDPPVGEWKFEEGSGSTANDTSGNGNTGTITNNHGAAFVAGKYGKGFDFYGTDGNPDYIDAGSAATLDNIWDGGGTVSYWIYPRGTNGSSYPSLYKASNGGWWLDHYVSGSNTSIRLRYNFTGDDAIWSTATDIPLNRWVHVAVSYNSDSASNDPIIYINGTLRSLTETTPTNARNDDTTSTLYIGSSGTTGNPENGKLDEIKIYNYARTPAQIAWDYNKGAPIAHWDFDECTGTALNDLSGNNYTGTIYPVTLGNTAVGTCTSSTATDMWYNGATGKFNASLDFDGSDDYAAIADTANLRFDASTADFSLFAWVKRTTTGEEYILSKEDADNDGYRFLFTSSNTVQCSEDATDVTSTSTITDANWHLIGCTIDRDGNGQVYIDGQADGSTQAMGTDAMATTANLTLGTRSYSATSYFNGQIDDVRIYNYPLSAEQVKGTYNGGAVRFGPNTGSP